MSSVKSRSSLEIDDRGRRTAVAILRIWIQNGFLLLTGVIVALLVGEIAARLFVPQYLVEPHPRGLYQVDATLGYVPTSNFVGIHRHALFNTTIKTNSLGLRDREYDAKKADAFRILILGDSFVWGYGVELQDTFVKRLETILQAEHSGRNYEVINAGVVGYGTEQELLFLKEKCLVYQPDLIIVGFFTGNDVRDNITGALNSFTVEGGYLVSQRRFREKLKTQGERARISTFLAQHSRLYLFLRGWYDIFMIQQGKRSWILPVQFETLRAVYSTELESGFALTKRLLLDIGEICAQRDIRMAIVVIPSQIQVEPEVWAEVRQVYDLDASEYILSKPDSILSRFGRENHIPTLDLLPKFQEVARQELLYFSAESHWNPAGHRLAAEELYKFLVAEKLIPQAHSSIYQGFDSSARE